MQARNIRTWDEGALTAFCEPNHESAVISEASSFERLAAKSSLQARLLKSRRMRTDPATKGVAGGLGETGRGALRAVSTAALPGVAAPHQQLSPRANKAPPHPAKASQHHGAATLAFDPPSTPIRSSAARPAHPIRRPLRLQDGLPFSALSLQWDRSCAALLHALMPIDAVPPSSPQAASPPCRRERAHPAPSGMPWPTGCSPAKSV